MTGNSIRNNGGEVQHYVPQFILKRFSEKKDKIHVFDKWTEKSFFANVSKVACEKSFNDLNFDGHVFTTERYLSKLESESAELISSIVESESLACLDDGKKLKLSEFFAVQFVRTKNFREMFKDVDEQIALSLISRGGDADAVADLRIKDHELELEYVGFLVDSERYAPHFFSKQWVLYKSAARSHFLISDNPVVLYNSNDYGLISGLGLAVRGVEIYFPISSNLLIGMLCRSIFDNVRSDYEKLKNGFDWNLTGKLGRLNEMMKMKMMFAVLENRSAFVMPQYFVEKCNSLQVQFAFRQVYSSSRDFSFVKRRIFNNPRLKQGVRMKVQ